MGKHVASENESQDLLSDARVSGALYAAPFGALIVSGALPIETGWRTAIWTVSLATMGAACVANALRCGRMHCYFTAPFFLIMALITLLFGLGIVPLGGRGWSTLSLTVLVGTLLLYFVPEAIFGRYRRTQ